MKRVLVVENDQNVREIVCLTLSRAGYLPIPAEDGSEAFAHLKEAEIIVLDLKMPKVTGEEFLRMIREDGNYTPVIVMSGVYTKAEVEKKLKQYEVVEFVEKPFSTKEILEAVKRADTVSSSISEIKRSTDRLVGFMARRGAARAT